MAMHNLHIAQHRDQLRYATTRGGSYRPRQRRFEMQRLCLRPSAATDDIGYRDQPSCSTCEGHLRQRHFGATRRGRSTDQGAHENCAPRFLPNIDGTMDPLRARVTDSTSCIVCDRADGEDTMLLCDSCNAAYHMECLMPPLSEVPAGEWHCRLCIRNAVLLDMLLEIIILWTSCGGGGRNRSSKFWCVTSVCLCLCLVCKLDQFLNRSISTARSTSQCVECHCQCGRLCRLST